MLLTPLSTSGFTPLARASLKGGSVEPSLGEARESDGNVAAGGQISAAAAGAAGAREVQELTRGSGQSHGHGRRERVDVDIEACMKPPSDGCQSS